MGMLMKCEKCGTIFDSDGRSHYDSDTNYGWIDCPTCGSDFCERAAECTECGTVYFEDELYDGLCDECAHNRLTEENIIKYLSDTRQFEDFITNFHEWFTPETIIKMIYDSFPEECEEYCANDLEDFVKQCR